MAGIQSHYEINVTYEGAHFFATAERSCVTEHDMMMTLRVFRVKFPVTEGFAITVTHWKCAGKTITE